MTATANGTMPRTKTRPAWSWEFSEYLNRHGLAAGELVVTEHRRGYDVVDVYDVDESYLPPEVPGRAFVLLKTHHHGDGHTVKGRKSAERVSSVYECVIGPGSAHYCTCTAGCTELVRATTTDTAPCLHVLACRELFAAGLFPVRQGFPHPQDRAGTVGTDGHDPREWADQDETAEWVAEAAGGKLVHEFGGC
jgi:hypothetical protein